jgi:PPP family 3-phenylpropionic acid transporter
MSLPYLPRPNPVAARFVPLYIGINFVGGVHLPFFPAWLEDQSFAPEAIGLLMMVMGMVRVVSGPVVGFLADAFSARRTAMILLAALGVLSYAGYAVLPGPAFIVLFSIIASMTFSAVGPLIEGVTMKTALLERFDYGHVRSFGSAAFILMNFASGVYLAAHGMEGFLPILIGSALFALAGAFMLPPETRPSTPVHHSSLRRDVAALMRQPAFLVFLVAAGLAQACHAFYYGFGTLNWKAQGYSADLIGFLWGLGVVAEIVLFAFSDRVVAWLGPVRLLCLGTASGLLRWTLIAFSPPLALLLPLQCLHAGTFGAAHLGAMHFIARAVPDHLVGTAQSIYSAVTIGVFMSVGQFAAGHLYADFGAGGYLLMTVFSATALGASVLLGRLWHGGKLGGASLA